jgi:hypothetical protein
MCLAGEDGCNAHTACAMSVATSALSSRDLALIHADRTGSFGELTPTDDDSSSWQIETTPRVQPNR